VVDILTDSDTVIILPLTDLKPGQSGDIVVMAANGPIRNRLWELGFRCGQRVELIRSAPLADPLEFKLNGSHISLRRTEAKMIMVKVAG
jgi:Fe2+ transport system protein FeoA